VSGSGGPQFVAAYGPPPTDDLVSHPATAISMIDWSLARSDIAWRAHGNRDGDRIDAVAVKAEKIAQSFSTQT
jgi:hypothetical protein